MTFSNLKPFMAYIDPKQYSALKRFSKKHGIPMSKLVRESIDARIAPGDPYSKGYNTGLENACQVVKENRAAQMRFPSGKSFADLVVADIEKLLIVESTDEEDMEEPGSNEGRTGTQEQSDSDLGL